MNVDVAAATARGIAVANAPGQQCRGRRRADPGLRADAPARCAAGPAISPTAASMPISVYEGREFFGARGGQRHAGAGRPGQRRPAGGGPRPGARFRRCSATTRPRRASSRPACAWSRSMTCSAGRTSFPSTPGPPPPTSTCSVPRRIRAHEPRRRCSSTRRGSRWWTRTRCRRRWPTGILAGAALDVTQRRPAGDRHPLLDLAECRHHTAHRRRHARGPAARARDGRGGSGRGWLAGELPDHLVNPEIAATKEAAS